MEWIWTLAVVAAAVIAGFAGGWAAVRVRHRGRTTEPAAAVEVAAVKEADWAVTWLHADVWVLANVGNADAGDIDVRFRNFSLTKSHLRDPMAPSEEASFLGVRHGDATILVSWTDPAGERKGPVRRAIPPKIWRPKLK